MSNYIGKIVNLMSVKAQEDVVSNIQSNVLVKERRYSYDTYHQSYILFSIQKKNVFYIALTMFYTLSSKSQI